MNQREFLSQLAEELKYLKPKDQNEVIRFYQQKINTAIDYGEKEERVIASLPSPKSIAEDIYRTKGVAYIELRKKAIRRQTVINFIGSILISVIIVLVFSYIAFLFGSMSVNLIKLLSQTGHFAAIDQISLIISGILLLLIELVIFIYFTDLCYLIIMYFISGSYQQLKKKEINEKVANFSISGTINKTIKKEKVLVKVALVMFFLLIGTAILNVATQGYLYRGSNNINSIVEKFEVTENNIEKIVYKGSNANFTITSDDKIENIEITYYHELDHNFKLEIENNILTIKFDDSKTYDLLNILKEPTQTIVIKLPAKYNYIDLDLDILQSSINILSANLGDVILKNTSGGYQIYNSNLESLTIKANKGTLVTSTDDETYINTSNNIENINIDILDGIVNLYNIKSDNFQIITSTANVDINNLICTSTQPLKNEKGDEIPNIKSSAGEIDIKQLNCAYLNIDIISTICNVYESMIDYCEISAQATSSITVTKTVVKEKINAFVSGSYLICEYVKSSNITLESNSGNIYLYNLSENILQQEDPETKELKEFTQFENDFNSISIYPEIILKKSVSTKFAIENGVIKDETTGNKTSVLQESLKSLTINDHTKGSIILKNTKIEKMSMVTNDAIIDMTNVYGKDYYIEMTDGQLSYYNDDSTGQTIKIKRNMAALVEIGNNIDKEE